MSEVKKMTRGEVASRNGRGGAPVWIIYRDSVYDVTNYVKEHPGGDVLLEEAGQDSTAAFEDVGHSGDARTVIAKYKIGELIDEEKKYDANGKKKRVVVQAGEEESGRSCLSCIFCGLL